jgi:hypothetical protein
MIIGRLTWTGQHDYWSANLDCSDHDGCYAPSFSGSTEENMVLDMTLITGVVGPKRFTEFCWDIFQFLVQLMVKP